MGPTLKERICSCGCKFISSGVTAIVKESKNENGIFVFPLNGTSHHMVNFYVLKLIFILTL